MPTNILEIPQNADNLWRTLGNLGKDICNSASSVVGVANSAEVYAVEIIIVLKSLSRKNYDIGRSFISKKYKVLPKNRKLELFVKVWWAVGTQAASLRGMKMVINYRPHQHAGWQPAFRSSTSSILEKCIFSRYKKENMI